MINTISMIHLIDIIKRMAIHQKDNRRIVSIELNPKHILDKEIVVVKTIAKGKGRVYEDIFKIRNKKLIGSMSYKNCDGVGK